MKPAALVNLKKKVKIMSLFTHLSETSATLASGEVVNNDFICRRLKAYHDSIFLINHGGTASIEAARCLVAMAAAIAFLAEPAEAVEAAGKICAAIIAAHPEAASGCAIFDRLNIEEEEFEDCSALACEEDRQVAGSSMMMRLTHRSVLQRDGDYLFFQKNDCVELDDSQEGGWGLREDCEEWQGDWYLSEWLDEHTFICDQCSVRHRNDRRADYDAGDICDDCDEANHEEEEEEDEDESGYKILDYSDSRASRFSAADNGERLKLGYEIEIELDEDANQNTCAGVIMERMSADCRDNDYAVAKYDSSLDNGFELVSRPDSLDEHRGQLVREWEAWESCDACIDRVQSMHIHASRAALSDLAVGKLLVFVNSQDNHDFMVDVAGRESEKWAAYDDGKSIACAKGLTHSADRYSAVNITRKTVEFRIFKGSIDESVLIRNLEFVDALCRFSMPAVAGIAEATSAGAFFDYVRKNRKNYLQLDGWLTRAGYLKEASKKKKENITNKQ